MKMKYEERPRSVAVSTWPRVKDTMWNRAAANTAFHYESHAPGADVLYSRCKISQPVPQHDGADDSGRHIWNFSYDDATPPLTRGIRQDVRILAGIDRRKIV